MRVYTCDICGMPLDGKSGVIQDSKGRIMFRVKTPGESFKDNTIRKFGFINIRLSCETITDMCRGCLKQVLEDQLNINH